jgi:hypothetical protein
VYRVEYHDTIERKPEPDIGLRRRWPDYERVIPDQDLLRGGMDRPWRSNRCP